MRWFRAERRATLLVCILSVLAGASGVWSEEIAQQQAYRFQFRGDVLHVSWDLNQPDGLRGSADAWGFEQATGVWPAAPSVGGVGGYRRNSDLTFVDAIFGLSPVEGGAWGHAPARDGAEWGAPVPVRYSSFRAAGTGSTWDSQAAVADVRAQVRCDGHTQPGSLNESSSGEWGKAKVRARFQWLADDCAGTGGITLSGRAFPEGMPYVSEGTPLSDALVGSVSRSQPGSAHFTEIVQHAGG
jgi:hypothetical protein